MRSKTPDGRGQFLGTEDIVRRLRQVQGRSWGSWPARLGGAGLAVVLLAGAWAVRPRGAAAPAHGPTGLAAHLDPVRAEGEDRGDDAPAPAARNAAPTSAASPVAGNTTHLRVRLLHPAKGATLAIDGTPAGPAAHWEGILHRGRHTVSVRVGHRRQDYVVALQNADQEVVVDLDAHRAHARNVPTVHPRR